MKQDPALSFKLLRYVNSPGMGLTQRIGTLDQAVMLLGRQKLHRWLTLLLFTGGAGQGLDWAIMENALTRARFAELIAGTTLSAVERDELFLAGMFSLLDIVLGMPLEAVITQLNAPAAVGDALLHKRGKYAAYLDLAMACEHEDEENVAVLSEAIGLDERQVNLHHVEAMIWARQVGAESG